MNEAHAMEKLFSYGTLQLESVQQATFGRTLQGSAAELVGYRLEDLEIRDAAVVATSGLARHPVAVRTGHAADTVPGTVFLITPAELAQALGIRPKLVFRGFVVAGCEPDEMGIGPVYAIPKLLKRHGLQIKDIDVWELNEAFASQVVYCRDKLGLDPEKLNPNGGSISIGHPFGMSGSRMVGTIANEMLRRKARYGVVTMCVGGGQGAAGLFEACN